MKLAKSYAQAGQDKFAAAIIGQRDATFLEIGSNHPTENSNTYALETELGWRGLQVDKDAIACQMCRNQRKSEVIEADVLSYDLATLREKDFDYLSLDVDSFSPYALLRLLLAGITFKVATVEHDTYSYPDGTVSPRDLMRAMLISEGYRLVCADVKSKGFIYEDWWVDTIRIHPSVWEPFDGRNGVEGVDIVP